MLPIEKILCPTDFSEPSYEALKAADELALHFSAEMLLVHVVSPLPVLAAGETAPTFDVASYQQEMEIDAKKSLDRITRERISTKVRSQNKIILGNAADEIVRVANDEDMDLIVIATHGLTGWRRLVFGSVAEKVVRFADCPVLTIQQPPNERE